ncbi:hypothetical protein SYJ56_01340 [Algoriphagus sp. D3-2-R+10]|uniref:hypothetical protein n=1 Tax=Algoriphagus aurantiacus TaxID=3103948 RepID=UPI002B3E9196|nr:hypothetical protein [Algoriphagus sp. D3-2-R+10]MEB2773930.1 hypothetical protein [Algoriphagus sp. D3-2-R+10]
MKSSFLTLSSFLLLISSCQNPQSEQALLFESLEKLPSFSIKDGSDFSMGNENILIRGKQQEITLESIQLLSGFTAALKIEDETVCLENPTSFTKYPFAAKQFYQLENQGLEVNQLQIISNDKLGVTLLYSIKNVDNSSKSIRFQFQPSTDLKPSVLMDSTHGSNALDQISYDEVTGVFTAKDEADEWYAVWGSNTEFSLSPNNSDCMPNVADLGASAGFEVAVELAANEEKVIPVFIAGSDQGEFTAMETLIDLRAGLYSDWDTNFALIDSLQKTAKISIPNLELQAAYDWSKYKIGLFEFNEAGEAQGSAFNPEELHSILDELSKDFISQLDADLFLFDESKPRHIAPGWELIQPSTLILMGIHGDAENRVTYIRPNLPADWKEASIDNLWVEDNKISISITSKEDQMTVEVTQTQKKAGLSIELPVEFSKVKVLGKEVSTDTKDGYRRILMTGDHVKVEAEKN